MRVFILSTGRSGSLTFSRACEHITNYTSGHESRSRLIGADRFDYPDWHIEADNRLAWFPGALDHLYGKEAFYVHLLRERSKTVESYNRRWVRNGSLVRAYCEGILQIAIHTLDRKRRYKVVGDFYDQVNENIRQFLKDKDKTLTLRIEDMEEGFPQFWKEIGAEGNLEAALETFKESYNRSKKSRLKHFRHEAKFYLMRLRRQIF